jgi:hypothetical protein
MKGVNTMENVVEEKLREIGETLHRNNKMLQCTEHAKAERFRLTRNGWLLRYERGKLLHQLGVNVYG